MNESKKVCTICQSRKIIPDSTIITNEGSDIRISVSKTLKSTSFLNYRAPAISKIQASISGDCGNIQLKAGDANKLWTAYQMSLKDN